MTIDTKKDIITVAGVEYDVDRDERNGYPLAFTATIEDLPGLVGKIYYDDQGSDPRKDFDNLGTLVCIGHLARTHTLGDDQLYNSDYVGDRPAWRVDCDRCEGSGDDPERWLVQKGFGIIAKGTEGACEAFGELYEHDHNVYVRPDSCTACKGEGSLDVSMVDYFKREHGAVVMLGVYFADYGSRGMQCRVTGEPEDDDNGLVYVTAEQIADEFGTDVDLDAPFSDDQRRNWGDDPPATRREAIVRVLKSEVETYAQYLDGDVYYYNVEDDESGYDDGCGGLYGTDYAETELFESMERAIVARIAELDERTQMAARDIATVGA